MSAAILIVLIIAVVIGQETVGWPTEGTTQWIVLGILIVSVIPLALTLIDLVAERGGKLGSRWLSVEFAAVVQPLPALELPTNIVPATQLQDSDREEMLQMLQSASAHEVVEIDLEDGEAWWLSRLLMLCAGAVQRSRPSAVVFVATDATVPRVFQGWAPPGELLESLLRRDAGLRGAFHNARRAVDQDDTIPGPMALEATLAGQLTGQGKPQYSVSTVDLERLFGSILRERRIERSDPTETRLEMLLTSPDNYVALTDAGQFVGLQRTDQAARAVLLNLLRRDRSNKD